MNVFRWLYRAPEAAGYWVGYKIGVAIAVWRQL
jgi:hypothetical protein